MIDHIWLTIYDTLYMVITVYDLIYKQSYMGIPYMIDCIWLTIYDSRIWSTTVYDLIYDWSHMGIPYMIDRIWLTIYDHRIWSWPYMNVRIWWFRIWLKNIPYMIIYGNHIWCRYMMLIYEHPPESYTEFLWDAMIVAELSN